MAWDESPAGTARVATSHIASVGRSNRYVARMALRLRASAVSLPIGPEVDGATFESASPRASENMSDAFGFMFASVAETLAFGFPINVYCPTVTS